MPCYDDRDTNIDRSRKAELERLEAMLCGIVAVLDTSTMIEARHTASILDTVLNTVDWKEVGASRDDFNQWHKEHKKKDAARKRQEAKETARKAAHKSALSKLSKAERKLLGL